MKKFVIPLILIFNFSFFIGNAQNVGINATGTNPDSSAMLDVSSTNKGLLIPRMSLTGNTDATTIPKPAVFLMVYNTNTSNTTGLTGIGLYSNIGTATAPDWQKVNASNTSGGNGVLNYLPKWTPNGNTLGNSLLYDNGAGVGISNSNPISKLYVNGHGAVDTALGDIQFTGGSDNMAKVGMITNNNDTTAKSNIGIYANAGRARNNVAFYATTSQSADTVASYTGLLVDNYDNHLRSNGAVQGIFSDLGNSGSGSVIGLNSFVNQRGANSNAIGYSNNVIGQGYVYGISSQVESAGNNLFQGIVNFALGLGGFADGYGIFNFCDNYGKSTGALNVGVGEDINDAYGSFNVAEAYNTGKAFGSSSTAIADGEGDAFGEDVYVSGGSFAGSSATNGKAIGVNILAEGNNDVAGQTVGMRSIISNAGTATNALDENGMANPAGYFTAKDGAGQGIYSEAIGLGFNNPTWGQMAEGVVGVAMDMGSGNTTHVGLAGFANNAIQNNLSVVGEAGNTGLNSNVGIYGFTTKAPVSTSFASAIYGKNTLSATNTFAAIFSGKVQINGTLTTTGPKPFTIDNPLDPENKLLRHFAVEGPEVLNNYSGNITTDATGKAIVKLPGYFESINKDFRYQLTAIGTFSQVIVSKEISQNQFEIATSSPNIKVSWQVMGVRNDGYMQKVNDLQAEEDKPEYMKGKYLTPEAFGKPESMGVFYGDTKINAQKSTSLKSTKKPSATLLEKKAHMTQLKTQMKAAAQLSKKEVKVK